MYVNHVKDIKAIKVEAPGVKNALKKVLIGPEQGWEGWVMRLFTLGSEGHTPKHTHSWPHINYVVKGEGVLDINGEEKKLQEGTVAYVPGGVEHQFKNTGRDDLAFICIVPEEGDV